MMKITYVILAHQYPEQIVRLVHRLDDPSSTILLHINRRSADDIYQKVLEPFSASPNIHFLPRLPVIWATFDIMKVFLSALDYINELGIPTDVLLLLSGQDYPIKSGSFIRQVLSSYTDQQVIEAQPLPRPNWGRKGGLERFERYYFWLFGQAHGFPPSRLMRMSPIAAVINRNLPARMQPYGGSPWCMLSSSSISYLREFVRTRDGQSLVRFFKHTWLSDELFLPTVLMNSPLRDTVVPESLHYIRWKDDGHPLILTTNDYNALCSSPKLFARKFDIHVDANVLAMIDGLFP